MKTVKLAMMSVVVALMLPASMAVGQPDDPPTGERVALAAFAAAERELIRSYFGEHGLPAAGHGEGERGKGAKGLPPGIAKNLARGKPLPPGIAKRGLPGGLVERLPPREGFEYVYIDDRVLLVETGTQIVHDILSDLLL